jgi:hypothetical protein
MAFKFKVKKRPNMAEAVASAFAAGAIQGGTTALQNAMKEREDRKNNSTKELNSFNSVIAGLPSTPENLSKIIPIKADIATGKITARNGLDILGYDLDYQTTQQKQAEIKAREEALGVVWTDFNESEKARRDSDIVGREREIMQEIDMVGLKPTENVINLRKKEAEIRKGVKTDPISVPKESIRKAADGYYRYVETGEKVFPEVAKISSVATATPNAQLKALQTLLSTAKLEWFNTSPNTEERRLATEKVDSVTARINNILGDSSQAETLPKKKIIPGFN